ncbi:MAG: glycine/betaine ABC transporter [Cyanobacteria bacterium QS_8_64_29]|nr:MAG: glycine/betaine ABC transporter [Cyanobacteria bacterium QS_8_64_29]
MGIWLEAWQYALAHADRVLAALVQHLRLVAVPLAIGLAIGLPLGLASARSRLAAAVLVNGAYSLRLLPSLAVLFLAMPYLGLTFRAAAVALTLLVVPPIVASTDAAFRNLSAEVREAAAGMGLSPCQRFWRIELPLALPMVLAGVKTATIEAIASATLAAFIGVGGLGSFVMLGFSLYDEAILLVGAVPIAALALLAEGVLSALQRWCQPP